MYKTVDIKTIKINPDNPRIIKDDKFAKLVTSIKDFPEMLQIRPIVVNADNIVLGGNMRLKACQEAGLKKIHIIKADQLTEDQQKEFIIKDNVGFGEWDWEDLANNWEEADLNDWGLQTMWAGLEVNNMTINDLDEEEEFNPMGEMDGKQRVVFLFEGPEEAESYLYSLKVEFKKYNIAWQVNMSSLSI